MSVITGITTSVDGFVAGPDDRPGLGLGRGGERLHYWVMGGPWTYDTEPVDFAFQHDVELEVRRVYTSPYATHVRYTVKR